MNSTTRKLKLVKHVIIDHTNMIWLSNPSQTHFFRQLHVNTPLYLIQFLLKSHLTLPFVFSVIFGSLTSFRLLSFVVFWDFLWNLIILWGLIPYSLFHIPRFITKSFSFVWLFLFCSFTCVYTHRHTHTYISNII